MCMHPYLAPEIARQREVELRRSAQGYRQLDAGPSGAADLPARAGWVLIEIGLTLARSSGDV